MTGPSRATHCTWPTENGSPIRELFTTLAPGGRSSVSVLLSALCPESALAEPGLYVVRPRLDTRHASGAAIGLHTFNGEVVGEAPMLLRIRQRKSELGR